MDIGRETKKDWEVWTSYGDDRPVTWKEGDLTVTRTTCRTGPGCHNGCFGLLYTDADGKLVKVEGDPEAPYNQGRLCSRCLALPQLVNHPDRILYPMKREKEDRGKDKWFRITWDQALEEITEKFNKIKEEYGARSVAFLQGTGRDISTYMLRLAWSFGSPNSAWVLSGSSCYLPRIAAMYGITGAFWIADCSQQYHDRYDDPNYKIPEVLMIWGNNPLQSNADGFFGHWVIDLMRRGSKLIVIDPRMTWLASKADLFLQVRSGTDGALALGMMNVIINEGLYDYDFVDRWCYGFEELKEGVQEWTPEKTAEVCWIEPEQVIAAARMYAAGNNSAIQMGLPFDMNNAEAIPQTEGVIDLMAITGNLDVPGGQLRPYFVMNTGFGWGYDILPKEVHNQRLGFDKYPFIAQGFNQAHPDSFMDAMEFGEPYPIKGLWMQSTNPLACTGGDPERQLKCYLSMDINVYVDLFMNPTSMACCDYFLPVATFAERDGIRTCDGPQFGATINKACQYGEVKGDPEICLMFGRRWNPEAWPWETDEEMHDAMLQDSFLKGITFKELQQLSPVYKQTEYKSYEDGHLRPDGQPGFPTSTGRVELWSTVLANCDLPPLPYYEEPVPSPVNDPDLWEKYPFIMGTGARDYMSFHSEHRQIEILRSFKMWPEVEINPEAAAELGIEDGDWVWLENQYGKCQHKAKVTPVVPKYMVMVDHGWWFPEEDGESPNNYGVWRVNVNQMMSNICGKSGFGTNFKSQLCKVYKVEEGE